jgi:cyclin B
VLSALDFKVNFIHASHFMKRFLRIPEPNSRLSMMAHFMNEVALMDEVFLGTRPSLLAAAVVSLALYLEKGSGTWIRDIELSSEYEIKDLEPLANKILSAIRSMLETGHRAVLKKYSAEELYAVSRTEFPESICF